MYGRARIELPARSGRVWRVAREKHNSIWRIAGEYTAKAKRKPKTSR